MESPQTDPERLYKIDVRERVAEPKRESRSRGTDLVKVEHV